MPSKRKFCRTMFHIEVLSESPIEEEIDLEGLHYAMTDGDCSGEVVRDPAVPIDGPTMAALLKKQGSDPSFFQLSEVGDDLEDE